MVGEGGAVRDGAQLALVRDGAQLALKWGNRQAFYINAVLHIKRVGTSSYTMLVAGTVVVTFWTSLDR